MIVPADQDGQSATPGADDAVVISIDHRSPEMSAKSLADGTASRVAPLDAEGAGAAGLPSLTSTRLPV